MLLVSRLSPTIPHAVKAMIVMPAAAIVRMLLLLICLPASLHYKILVSSLYNKERTAASKISLTLMRQPSLYFSYLTTGKKEIPLLPPFIQALKQRIQKGISFD